MIVDLHKSWVNDDMPCLKKNPEMFFGDFGTMTLSNPSVKIQARWNRAKAVCQTCPVMEQCARDNLGEVEGVWGGLDPADRIEMRRKHSAAVHQLTGEKKLEYAELAYTLRTAHKYSVQEAARIIGISPKACTYLYNWYTDWQEEQVKVVDLELPEPETVVDIAPNAQFPDVPPRQGDGWARYNRRVIAGYYLGQTEDDAWICFRARILSGEWSICWLKARDVKLTRDVARKVMVRVGNGSRIYGTTLSGRGTSQAG